jgi:hypothetical protein
MAIDSFQYLNKLQSIGGNKVSFMSPDIYRLTRYELIKMFNKNVTEKDIFKLKILMNQPTDSDTIVCSIKLIDKINCLNNGFHGETNLGDKIQELIVLKGCYEAIKYLFNRNN